MDVDTPAVRTRNHVGTQMADGQNGPMGGEHIRVVARD